MSTKSRRTANTNVTDFNNFFQGWLVRQENYRQQLQSSLTSNLDGVNEQGLRDLIARVLAHYQQYYEEKSRIANHDVFLVFSPPWFSCFEQSLFWIAGFKPGLAFRIVRTSVVDLIPEQAERMDSLRTETVEEERRLESNLTRIQENVAAPAVVEIMRMRDGTHDRLDTAIDVLKGELEEVVASADMLRTRTAERVVEILTPVQNVRFLAAATELQMNIRNWGWHVERESRR